MNIQERAVQRARAGKTLPVGAIIQAIVGDPVKLARAPDSAGHEAFVRQAIASKDPIDLGVLGDYLEENGMPGAMLFRMAHEQGRGHGYHSGRDNLDYAKSLTNTYVTETGGAARRGEFDPHATEIIPWHLKESGAQLHVAHTGASATPLHVSVRIDTPADLLRAVSDLPKPMAQAIVKQLRDAFPGHPVKLARAQSGYTYVGGVVPGGQRALGFWAGGAEHSTLVPLPLGVDARRLSLTLAARNKQKTAVWFTPGSGRDLLHVLRVRGDPRSIYGRLRKHGVSYATIVPSAGSSLVHVVDQGGELSGPVKAFAAESGAQYESVPGSAGYAELK